MVYDYIIITLTVGSFGNGDTIGAASELIGVALAAAEVGSGGRSKSIRTTSVGRVLATAALVVWSTSGGRVVGTASEFGVLASTTVEVWSASWQNVVGTTLEGTGETAAFLVGSVGRSFLIVAASEWRVIARQAAPGAVGSKSCSRAAIKLIVYYCKVTRRKNIKRENLKLASRSIVRAATKVRCRTIFGIDDAASLEVRAIGGLLAIWAASESGIGAVARYSWRDRWLRLWTSFFEKIKSN